MLCIDFNDNFIITVKGIDYRCLLSLLIIIYDIKKSDVTDLLVNSVLDGCGYI